MEVDTIRFLNNLKERRLKLCWDRVLVALDFFLFTIRKIAYDTAIRCCEKETDKGEYFSQEEGYLDCEPPPVRW